MKSKIFLYLFVFALLLAIFQYVNSKNVFEIYESKLNKADERVEAYKDSIMSLHGEVLDLMYFNLENNDDALSYFESDGYDTAELIPFIKDEIYKLNENKDEHPLVPYVSMTDGRMLINKVRLLNHKWILADFSDGKHWGELFITYEIIDKKELKFKLVESFMYPPQTH
jgi:hypothetical protein